MLAVTRVEVTRLARSRSSFTLLLLVPALQVLLFGYAIRPQPDSVRVAVAGPDTALSASVIQALKDESVIQKAVARLAPGAAEAAVRGQQALIGIELPAQDSQVVRVVVDSTNAALTETAAAKLAAGYWHTVATQSAFGQQIPALQIERLYNPEARADWTFLPALIGVTVMISMIMFGALCLAREREAGTWETVLSLPLSRTELITGKLLPYVVIGTAQGLLVLAAGAWLFAVPTKGAVFALAALLPVFSAAHFLLGYAISARAATQLEAVQGAIAYYLPAMLLSGFLYPFDALPSWAQAIGRIFPLTHFIRAAREVLLQGRGLEVVLDAAWPVGIFATVAAAAGLVLQARRL
jgi:ABC-2 type transport system permease protein